MVMVFNISMFLFSVVLLLSYFKCKKRELFYFFWLYILFLFSMTLSIFRGDSFIHRLITIVFANALSIYSFAFFKKGISIYFKVDIRKNSYLIIVLFFVLIHFLFTEVVPSIKVRKLNATLFFIIVLINNLHFLIKKVERRVRDKYFFIAAILLLMFVALVRILLTLFIPQSSKLFTVSTPDTWIFIGYFIIYSSTFVFIIFKSLGKNKGV